MGDLASGCGRWRRRHRDHGRRRRGVARGWLGKDGAAATAKAGTLAIECSTVSYSHALDLARELRGRGLIYIDCPVTGLPDAAASGKLTLLVGAEPADLERARPFLSPLSTTIRHFGAVGTGTVYKLINNLMGAIQIAGIAEGLAIAEQAGLDMKLVLEAVETGVAASPQVIRHSRRMAARDFSGANFHRGAAAQGCRLCGGAGREPAVRRPGDGTRRGRGLCAGEGLCAR